MEARERVQKYFTKRIHGLKGFDYKERLFILKLESLEVRRLHFDLAMYFKIIHSLVDLNFDDFFAWSHGGVQMRGHNFKLELKNCNNNLLRFSFANRCVNCWNALPENVVNSSSINMFMYRLKMLIWTNTYWSDISGHLNTGPTICHYNSVLLTVHDIFNDNKVLSYLILSHLISSHLISSHLISSHLISSHLISSHLISSHLISSHLTSPHLISSHLISSHLISSHLISSYYRSCTNSTLNCIWHRFDIYFCWFKNTVWLSNSGICRLEQINSNYVCFAI